MSNKYALAHRAGTVAAFDAQRGAGTVTAADGVGEWPFHCTQIDGGARAIPEGTDVTFSIVAGLPGKWEAVAVSAQPGMFLCPVCGASNGGDAGKYDICEMCEWEDDPVQRDDSAAFGANGSTTLSDARTTWIRSLIEQRSSDVGPETRG
jgi:cold shock CspA family protein